jgi:16S rRNA (guanine966-N2)-methyltransferase
MRIIAGYLRHRLLKRPDEKTTRPTTDRVRESIFNILSHKYNVDFSKINVLDAFAGSGAMGLEALSRGAKHTYFVENDFKVSQVLQKNISNLRVEHCTTIYRTDILKLGSSPVATDIIFLDPPYQSQLLEPACAHLIKTGWVQPETLICIENAVGNTPEEELVNLKLLEKRVYGQSAISFWMLPLADKVN